VLNYLFRRLALMVPTLLLITAVVFAVVKLAPGNPFSMGQASGEAAVKQMNPQDYESLLKRYGLDRPWYVQYGRWLKNAATGDFGDSFSERRPVGEVFFNAPLKALEEKSSPGAALDQLLSSKFGATLFLNLLSLLLMTAVALPVGLRAAARRGGWFDRVSGVLLYALYSLPNYWVAVLLILLVGVKLQWLPFIGMRSDGFEALSTAGKALDLLKHAALPALCLSYGGLAFISRFARGAVLDVLGQDYIRTARAKGLDERRVLYRHALRNALIPLLTLFGLMLPALISGSVIIEQIFSWPGLGQMYVKAIYTRDYPLIMAESLLGALAVLASNLITDVAYAFADPRVRLE
jgi:peptide/nickel transport system permease protein